MKTTYKELVRINWEGEVVYNFSSGEVTFGDYYQTLKTKDYVVVPVDSYGAYLDDEDLEFLSEKELNKRFNVLD